jgi:hypothetical protein
MNSLDFYYKQLVLETDLDTAFTNVDTALKALYAELGFCKDVSNTQFGGLVVGGTCARSTGYSFTIGASTAIDNQARRIYMPSQVLVNAAKDGYTAIGSLNPAGPDVSVTPGENYDRWVSIFLVYDQLLTDLVNDGYGVPVFKTRTDSYKFHVKAGTQAAHAAVPVAERPLLETGEILVMDFLISNVGGVITVADPDTTRQELLFAVEASGTPNKTLRRHTLREALKDLLEYFNDHVGGIDDQHAASAILFENTGLDWATSDESTFHDAGTVQDALEAINTDLKAKTVIAGARRIGAAAVTGSRVLTDYTPLPPSAINLTVGSIESQLAELLVAVNRCVVRGGDSSVGDLVPYNNDTNVNNLGSAAKRWNAFVNELNSSLVSSHLLPKTTDTYDLGSDATTAWNKAFINTLHILKTITVDNEDNANLAISAVSSHASGATIAALATGTTAQAISGVANGTSGIGVSGLAIGSSGKGVQGTSVDGLGVYGSTEDGSGVKGESTGDGDGVQGEASGDGYAVHGKHTNVTAGYGVYGEHAGTHGAGVAGYSLDASGVYGTSVGGTGVWGDSTSGEGLVGTTASFNTSKTISKQFPLFATFRQVPAGSGWTPGGYVTGIPSFNVTIPENPTPEYELCGHIVLPHKVVLKSITLDISCPDAMWTIRPNFTCYLLERDSTTNDDFIARRLGRAEFPAATIGRRLVTLSGIDAAINATAYASSPTLGTATWTSISLVVGSGQGSGTGLDVQLFGVYATFNILGINDNFVLGAASA